VLENGKSKKIAERQSGAAFYPQFFQSKSGWIDLKRR